MKTLGLICLDEDNNMLIDGQPPNGFDEVKNMVKAHLEVYPDILYEEANSYLFKKTVEKLYNVDLLFVIRLPYITDGHNFEKFALNKNFKFTFDFPLSEIHIRRNSEFSSNNLTSILDGIVKRNIEWIL